MEVKKMIFSQLVRIVQLAMIIGVAFQGCDSADMKYSTERLVSDIDETVSTLDAAPQPAKKPMVDNDQILRGLIDEERKQRIEADMAINERIDDLADFFWSFKGKIEGKINDLVTRDDDLAFAIKQNRETFSKRMAFLDNKWQIQFKGEFAKVNKKIESVNATHEEAYTNLRSELLEKANGLDADLQKKYEELLNKLAAVDKKILAGDKALREENKKEREELKANLLALIDKGDQELLNEINQVDSEIVALGKQTAQTLAKHDGELAKVKGDLSELEKIIEKSVHDVRQELLAKQDAQFLELENTLKEKEKKIYETIESEGNKHKVNLEAALEEEVTSLQAKLNELDEDQKASFKSLTNQMVEESVKATQDKAELLLRIKESEAKSQDALQEEKDIRLVTEQRLREAIVEIEERQTAEHDRIQRELEQLIGESAETLKTEMNKQNEIALNAIKEQHKEIVNFRLEYYGNVNDLNEKIKKSNDLIMKVAQDQEDFKAEVARTYATKKNLEAVKEYADTIFEITSQLGRKIDLNDAIVRQHITAEFSALSKELKGQIDEVKADVNGLRKDFISHVGKYKSQMSKMRIEFKNHIISSRKSLLSSIYYSNKKARAEMLGKLQGVCIRFEKMSQDMKESFSSKIVKVEKNLQNEVSKNKAEIESAKIEAQKSLNLAIEEEQNHRKKMEQELNELKNDLEEVKKVAERSERIARFNSEQVKKLRTDFEENKEKVKQEFEAVRADYSKRINLVAMQAQAAVRNLGAQVQKSFAKTVTEIAELKQSQAATNKAMTDYIRSTNATRVQREAFEARLAPARNNSLKGLIALVENIGEVHTNFFATLNPDQNKKPFYDTLFKPIMEKCGGDENATFANALGMDSFQFLSREYIKLSVLHSIRMRGGDLFYNLKKLTGSNDLHSLVLAMLMRNTTSNNDKTCYDRIESWARLILIGNISGHKYQKEIIVLRDKLKRSRDLERSLRVFYNQAGILKGYNNMLENLLKDEAKKLYNENMRLKYALALLQATHKQQLLNERKLTFAAMRRVQEQAMAGDEKLREAFDGLDNKLESFEKKVGDQIEDLKENQVAITDTLKNTLDLVMTIAQRSGFHDLREAAVAAAKPLDYKPKRADTFDAKITDIQHFFRAGYGAIRNGNPVCSGKKVRSGRGIRGGLQQHGPFNWCWVNFRGSPSRWHTHMSIKTVWYRLFGDMAKVKVTTTGYNKTFNFFNNQTSGTKVHAGSKNGVFDINSAWHSLLRTPVAVSWGSAVLNFTPYDFAGNAGDTRSYRIRLFSPIVLDFVNIGKMRSISAEDSYIYFDLDNDGIKERTGWVKGNQGSLLALDLNGNGIIDNGSELFGEATRLANGKSANNGYLALAQYDKNKDGVIDQKDSVFNKLLVWSDHNTDGISDKNEVVSLSETKVTSIGVKYKELSGKDSFESGNVYKYEGKFWGPEQCGKKGCKSYDVFFSTNATLLSDGGSKAKR